MAKRTSRKATISGTDLSFLETIGKDETEYEEASNGGLKTTRLEKTVIAWANIIVKNLKKQLNDNKSNASGGLSASAQATPTRINDASGTIELDILIDPYYVFVNDGRTGKHQKFIRDKSRLVGTPKTTARMPPFQPISDWIRYKGVAGLSKVKTGFRTRQTGRVADKLKKAKLVDSIRWGIYNNGIAPTYFFTNVVNQEAFTALNKAAAKALGRDIAVNIKFDFKKK